MPADSSSSGGPGPSGLHSYLHEGRARKARPYVRAVAPERLATETWTVPALCAAYQWPTGLAGGGKIAIVELDGGWTSGDMEQFFNGISQPMPQIQDVSVDGTQNNPNQHLDDPQHDPDQEVAL